jgi:hypothetical protein
LKKSDSVGPVPVPTATFSTCVDSIAENIVGDIVDAAEEELDGFETPLPSVATECEASEVEKKLTPATVEVTKTSIDATMEEPVLVNSIVALVGSKLETAAVTKGLVTTTDAATDAKPKLLVLCSNQSLDRGVAAKQQKAFAFLDVKGINYGTLDGAEPKNKDRCNNPFTLSGIRAQYPQLFLVQGDQLKFWGDWERFDTSNEMGTLTEELVENVSSGITKSHTFSEKCEASEVENELTPQSAEETKALVFASGSDQEVMAVEMPDAAVEHPEFSPTVPTATPSDSFGSTIEKVGGDIADAAEEEEVDVSETPSPSLATECEASEAAEQEGQPVEDIKPDVSTNNSDQEVMAVEIPDAALEHPEASLTVPIRLHLRFLLMRQQRRSVAMSQMRRRKSWTALRRL